MQFARSNAIGLLALFVALGGTAYAIQKAPKNSVVSSSIKKGAVKASDLADGAVGTAKLADGTVTGAKLGANSVDSSKVPDNSLSGADIDESSLSLPLSLANDTPPLPHEARIVISPAEMAADFGKGPNIVLQTDAPAAFFSPSTDEWLGAVTEVPLDRVPGTGLEARIFWEAPSNTGDVTWQMGFAVTDVGPMPAVPKGTNISAPSTEEIVETTLLQIPAEAVSNGDPIALLVTRNADAGSDTTTVFARLRLVEIRYTASG